MATLNDIKRWQVDQGYDSTYGLPDIWMIHPDHIWLNRSQLRDLPTDLPTKVSGFECEYNMLTSLKGCSEHIFGSLVEA